MNKYSTNASITISKPSSFSLAAGILTASVLGYCGYKIVNNKLQKTKYESNPYKDVEAAKKALKA